MERHHGAQSCWSPYDTEDTITWQFDRPLKSNTMTDGCRTIVVQSFRRHDVPEWITRCVTSVQSWAALSDFQYKMMGDEFLTFVPDWYRQKAGRYTTVVTDLARLVLVRECLKTGSDRVIWVDADVVVFNPFILKIDPDLSYGYSREVWIEKKQHTGLIAVRKVNNSACLFCNDDISLTHLNEYIGACQSIVAGLTALKDHTEVGTKFLTSRDGERSLPILRGFGLFSPTILRALLDSDVEVLHRFLELQGDPLCAANLCNFLRAKRKDAPGIADETYLRVLDKLL
jgi:hypothetical protein